MPGYSIEQTFISATLTHTIAFVVDENECKTGMAACAYLAACLNSPSSYVCFCPKGTKGFKEAWRNPCVDVDECKKEVTTKVCQKDAVCKNTPGSFTCLCKKGFKAISYNNCADIDECEVFANKVCHNIMSRNANSLKKKNLKIRGIAAITRRKQIIIYKSKKPANLLQTRKIITELASLGSQTVPNSGTETCS